MPFSASPYRILNVAPDADPAVIEAAYKALIKKHHPDRQIGGGEHLDGSAARLNEAWSILRDPHKRALYDAEERARLQAITSSIPQTERSRSFEAVRPPRRRGSARLMLLVLALVGVVIWLILKLDEGRFSARALPPADAVVRPAAVQKAVAQDFRREDAPPVSKAVVAKAVAEFQRIHGKSGLRAVVGYSMDCFWAQTRTQDIQELDFCIAFDQAASRLDEEASSAFGLPQIPHLQPQNVSTRHFNAGRLITDDDNWINARLDRVRELTDEAVAELNSPKSPLAAESLRLASRSIVSPERPAPVASQRPRNVVRESGSAARRPTQRRQRTARPRAAPGSRAQRAGEPNDFLEREDYIY